MEFLGYLFAIPMAIAVMCGQLACVKLATDTGERWWAVFPITVVAAFALAGFIGWVVAPHENKDQRHCPTCGQVVYEK